jgi:hypothetical protein
MPWFRFYNEAADDLKLARVCRETGLPKVAVLGSWAVLLVLANRSPRRGYLMMSEYEALADEEIRAALEMDAETYRALMASFRARGMVSRGEDGCYAITNWDKRNFESDDATARSRRWRKERRGAGTGTAEAAGEPKGRLDEVEKATLHKAQAATMQERSVQRGCNGLDTDTETETETETDPDAETERNQIPGLRLLRVGAGERETRPPAVSRPLGPGNSAPAPDASAEGRNGAKRPAGGLVGGQSGPERPVTGASRRARDGTGDPSTAAEDDPAGLDGAAGVVPDPGTLTVRQIRGLTLDEAGWEVLQAREVAGRGRASALGHIDRMSNRAPPAVVIYQGVASCWPQRALWDEIGRAVGDDPVDLQFWERVVKGYLLCGWNKLNLGAMLEFYGRRQIPPGSGRGDRQDGRGPRGEEMGLSVDPVAAARQLIAERGWE